ncbi:hypothetical protein FGO68_gene15186 [Halteria grandinella]|uniref:Uncharacterized protein n=1 Tax=Halteria grandinella TaxID=5974 RepID=A0A8J8T0C9_HALGN|nr:hypothetical protein FGO68_gene15186 [Halteria grandinella]
MVVVPGRLLSPPDNDGREHRPNYPRLTPSLPRSSSTPLRRDSSRAIRIRCTLLSMKALMSLLSKRNSLLLTTCFGMARPRNESSLYFIKSDFWISPEFQANTLSSLKCW